ncbi:hypothetical protein [Fibrobacter sp. UBA3629]|uniref:hypothetical protein n=1 Tax=Fibrobacter sp. UBA3629 TaxID=1946530 RepID=UPI0025BA0A24|nr:hypothetical protein [Fibrobacter sp. UBA3629]
MAKILFKKQLSPAVFQFRVEAPLIAQERKAGHVRGACPSGWLVPNTVEAEWLMRFTDDIYYRVNAINGNTNASKKAWVSYDVERLWPAKQLNGVWIKYQDYVWVWVPTDYISFNFQNDAYKQTDYFYVYCIKTN